MDYLLWHCQVAVENHGGILLSLLLAGLIGSVNHCAGMCGPFVVAQLGARGEDTDGSTLFQRLKGGVLLPYHLGRITTYVLLGIIGASFSQALIGTPVQRSIAVVMLSIAGLLFFANAVPRFKSMFSGFHLAGFGKIFGDFLGHLSRPFFAGQTIAHRYLLGFFLGFLPCGLVIAAVMAVAATGDPVAAAIGMIMFGVGTIPALLLVGVGAKSALKRWPQTMRQITTGIMAINGVGLMVLAGGMAF